MFYYNVTCRVEESIETKWVEWMQSVHIPEVMKTGCFIECKMLLLADVPGDDDGIIYAIQYLYESEEDFKRYNTKFGPKLKQKTSDAFGEKVLPFRTTLKILKEFK